MKVRKIAIIIGGITAFLILGSAIWMDLKPAEPSREDVRRYFESVPNNLGWVIHSKSDWDRGWRDLYNELPIDKRIWLYVKCTFSGYPEDTDSYAFKTQRDYVDTSVTFNGNFVEQIRIYGGWTPNPDTYVLQKDLRRNFPNLKVDVLPWSK